MAISSAVDASAVARVVGIKTIFKDLRGGGVSVPPATYRGRRTRRHQRHV